MGGEPPASGAGREAVQLRALLQEGALCLTELALAPHISGESEQAFSVLVFPSAHFSPPTSFSPPTLPPPLCKVL